MGVIYLVHPQGSKIRSIDRLKPKDRKKPANCNNSNIKFGKHLSDYSDLKNRYEKRVGNVYIKVVVELPDNQISNFESLLKKVFSKYIKNFQEESKTLTKEWMSGITLEEADKIILSEFDKFRFN